MRGGGYCSDGPQLTPSIPVGLVGPMRKKNEGKGGGGKGREGW